MFHPIFTQREQTVRNVSKEQVFEGAAAIIRSEFRIPDTKKIKVHDTLGNVQYPVTCMHATQLQEQLLRNF